MQNMPPYPVDIKTAALTGSFLRVQRAASYPHTAQMKGMSIYENILNPLLHLVAGAACGREKPQGRAELPHGYL